VQASDGVRQRVPLNVGEHHLHARFRKGLAERKPDAARPACHECRLAGELPHISPARRLSPGGLTADGRDGDMPHRRIRLRAMPVAFTGLDMHDITDIDLTLLTLRRHHAGA
jgi:hypothetical protein